MAQTIALEGIISCSVFHFHEDGLIFRFHELRHTYASLLIADKTPLVVVAKNLGHAQTSTTSNIYSHVIASAEAKAAQVTDKFAEDIHPKFTPKAKKESAS